MTIDPMEGRLQSMETRLIEFEIGQKWMIWIVGIILAMVVGNFAVTIAMAIHLLTEQ